MNQRSRIQLALHGAIVILAGLCAGIPYALVVTGAMAGEERAWRMAHGEGIQNGLVMLAVSGIGGSLVLDERRSAWCAWSLAVAGYGNVIAAIFGAATGNRGLAFTAPLANVIVYLLFVIAIVAVYAGLGLVVSGALRALRNH